MISFSQLDWRGDHSSRCNWPILGGAGGRLRWEGAAGDRSMRWQSSGRCGRSTWHGARFFGDPHNLQDEFIEMRTHQCVFMSSIVRA
jgi:hypothetical protein